MGEATVKTIKYELPGLLLAMAAALPLVIYWHCRDAGYPHGDPAYYLTLSMRMYRRFISEGIGSGLQGLYTIRNEKALFHPVLAVPGFFLSGGKNLLAQSIAVEYIYAVLACFAYVFARIYLPRIESVLAVALLLNTQWVNQMTQDLNAELPFTLTFLAAWTFILKSRFFTLKWPTWVGAVLFGLGFCTRPAEMLILSVFPALLLIRAGVSSGALSFSEVRKGLALALLSPVGMVYAFKGQHASNMGFEVYNSKYLWMSAIGPAFSLVLYLVWFRRGTKSLFLKFVLAAGSVVMLWFGPFIYPMVIWGLGSSVLPEGNGPQHIGLPAILHELYGRILGPGIWVMIALAAILGWKTFRKPVSDSGIPRLGFVFFGILGSAALHIALGAYGHNPLARYYLAESTCLYLVILVILLSSSRWIWSGRVVLMAALTLSVLGQLSAFGVLQSQTLKAWQSDFGQMNLSAPMKKDPIMELLQLLPLDIHKQEVIAYPVAPVSCLGWSDFFGPALMAMDYDFKFQCPQYWEWQGRGKEHWKEFTDGYKSLSPYYLVGPTKEIPPKLLSEIKLSKPRSVRELQPLGSPLEGETYLLIEP